MFELLNKVARHVNSVTRWIAILGVAFVALFILSEGVFDLNLKNAIQKLSGNTLVALESYIRVLLATIGLVGFAVVAQLLFLVFDKNYREKALSKILSVKERDEREELIVGRAARSTFFLTIVIILGLFALTSIEVGNGPRMSPASVFGPKFSKEMTGFKKVAIKSLSGKRTSFAFFKEKEKAVAGSNKNQTQRTSTNKKEPTKKSLSPMPNQYVVIKMKEKKSDGIVEFTMENWKSKDGKKENATLIKTQIKQISMDEYEKNFKSQYKPFLNFGTTNLLIGLLLWMVFSYHGFSRWYSYRDADLELAGC